MLQTQIFGVISRNRLTSKEYTFPSFSDKSVNHVIYQNGPSSNTPFFFDIHLLVHNKEMSHYFENESLQVISIGYSFEFKEIAKEITNLYLLHGIENIRNLKGYYSFIIIDHAHEKIYIGSDSAGICPIYYFSDEDKLLFSNNLKSIVLNASKKLTFNLKVLFELFHLGMVTPPDTLIENVYSMPSSHYIEYIKNSTLKAFPTLLVENAVFDEETVYELLKNSIAPLAQQSKIGVMCSGGLDSTLITALTHEQTDNKIDLFTLYYDPEHPDVTNTKLLAKLCNGENHYFKPDFSEHIISNVLEGLWLGESESVGTLSFNLALEVLFSKFILNFNNGIILTGDVYSTRMESASDIYIYMKKYALISEKTHKLLLKSTNSFGYLNFSQKYHSNLQYNYLTFPEVLILRLTGKIRMNATDSQKYHLPFVAPDYLQYIESLCSSDKSFNYRLMVAKLAKHRELLPKEILLTTKSWLPSWVEHANNEKLISSLIEKFSHQDSFCYSIFGDTIKELIYDEQYHKNYRLIMALFYLELFHKNFIENPKNLVSKDIFIANNA